MPIIYVFSHHWIVVLPIPVYLCLNWGNRIDQSTTVYASTIDSGKHFLPFPRTIQQHGWHYCSRNWYKGKRGLFYILQKVLRRYILNSLLLYRFALPALNQSMDGRTNYGKLRGGGSRRRSRDANTNTGTCNYHLGWLKSRLMITIYCFKSQSNMFPHGLPSVCHNTIMIRIFMPFHFRSQNRVCHCAM